uniref:Extracellular globin n=1 Tax=Siboglinum ekmani TaxID=167800 RepID=A0A0S2MLP8_9ANNE
MQTLLILLGLVAAVYAGDRCKALQRLKVKSQWAEVYKYGNAREEFGIAVWKEFFAHESAARDLFTRVNGANIYSSDFKAHINRVMGGLDMCISLLDEEETLNAALAHLNGQHKERGIDAKFFDSFGAAILRVIPERLGEGFDQDAWSGCFSVIADGINKA